MAASLVRLKYEVFGKVQGVYFRQYTIEKAQELKLNGWVRNTSRGTVEGEAEGPRENITKMKHWLRNVGSPASKVIETTFSEDDIAELKYKDFSRRATK